MRILLAIETLKTGGAEKFVVGIAKELSKNHKVILFYIYKELVDTSILEQVPKSVKIVYPCIFLDNFIKKLDGFLFRMNIPLRCRDVLVAHQFSKILDKYKIDVVHSNLFNTDHLCSKVAVRAKIPVLATVHGDYLNFYRQAERNIRVYCNLNFIKRMRDSLSRLDRLIYISDQQRTFFQSLSDKGISIPKLTKIYNGVSVSAFRRKQRKMLGIGGEDFVFGMVSRGIPEKGWSFAIKSFLQIKNDCTHLILVGESGYLKDLKNEFNLKKNVHFVGFSTNPFEWIDMFDVGLLPSVYSSESLPTSVIEYLALGKWVIATDVGEVKNMLKVGGSFAGDIIPLNENKVNIGLLADAMKSAMLNRNQIRSTKIPIEAFEKFNIVHCTEKYLDVYKTLIDK